MRKSLAAIALCLLLSSCSYHLRGTGSSLPPHIKKIYVPMFSNQTTRFQLDLKLTEGVRDELVARGKVELTGDQADADAILTGDIVNFTVNPISFTEDASADTYNIIIVAKIVLRDLVNRRVLFSNPSFTYIEQYEVSEGTDFETVEQEAIGKVAVKFARTLVITILEGF
jgi:outer membrane lipopolysaccharide assembly protein LptE/RlpB